MTQQAFYGGQRHVALKQFHRPYLSVQFRNIQLFIKITSVGAFEKFAPHKAGIDVNFGNN
jgi:hypothetical protein